MGINQASSRHSPRSCSTVIHQCLQWRTNAMLAVQATSETPEAVQRIFMSWMVEWKIQSQQVSHKGITWCRHAGCGATDEEAGAAQVQPVGPVPAVQGQQQTAHDPKRPVGPPRASCRPAQNQVSVQSTPAMGIISSCMKHLSSLRRATLLSGLLREVASLAAIRPVNHELTPAHSCTHQQHVTPTRSATAACTQPS